MLRCCVPDCVHLLQDESWKTGFPEDGSLRARWQAAIQAGTGHRLPNDIVEAGAALVCSMHFVPRTNGLDLADEDEYREPTLFVRDNVIRRAVCCRLCSRYDCIDSMFGMADCLVPGVTFRLLAEKYFRISILDNDEQYFCESCVIRLDMTHAFWQDIDDAAREYERQLRIMWNEKVIFERVQARQTNEYEIGDMIVRIEDIVVKEESPLAESVEKSVDMCREESVNETPKRQKVDETIPNNEDLLEILPCTVENQELNTVANNLGQIEEISKNSKFKCFSCNTFHDSKELLSKHLLLYHKSDSKSCKECNILFETARALNRHLLLHDPNRPHKCTHCPLRFHSKRTLARHRRITHRQPKDSHNCEECQLSFESARHFKYHALLHDPKRPYQCTLCTLRFNSRRDQARHKLTSHPTEEKAISFPARCNICNTNWADNVSFTAHMFKHENDPAKQFKCSYCESRFRSRNYQIRHELSKHWTPKRRQTTFEVRTKFSIDNDYSRETVEPDATPEKENTPSSRVDCLDDQTQVERTTEAIPEVRIFIEDPEVVDLELQKLEEDLYGHDPTSVDVNPNASGTEQTIASASTLEGESVAKGEQISTDWDSKRNLSDELAMDEVTERLVDEIVKEESILAEPAQAQTSQQLQSLKPEDGLKQATVNVPTAQPASPQTSEAASHKHQEQQAVEEADIEVLCYICDTKLANMELLFKHLNFYHRDHKKSSYRCEKCGLLFSKSAAFNTHLAEHDQQHNPIKCSQCLERFQRHDARDRHERVVHRKPRKDPSATKKANKRQISKKAKPKQTVVEQDVVEIIDSIEDEIGTEKSKLAEPAAVQEAPSQPIAIPDFNWSAEAPQTFQVKILISDAVNGVQELDYMTGTLKGGTLSEVSQVIETDRSQLEDQSPSGKKLAPDFDVLVVPFRCYMCHTTLKSKRMMYRHLLKVHKRRHKKCMDCNLTFNTLNMFNHHLAKHEPLSVWCRHCAFKYCTEEERLRHERSMHPFIQQEEEEDPGEESVLHKCYLCDIDLGHIDMLTTHIKIEHDLCGSYYCEKCDKRFRKTNAFNTHLSMHDPRMPYQCVYCQLGFHKMLSKDKHDRVCRGKQQAGIVPVAPQETHERLTSDDSEPELQIDETIDLTADASTDIPEMKEKPVPENEVVKAEPPVSSDDSEPELQIDETAGIEDDSNHSDVEEKVTEKNISVEKKVRKYAGIKNKNYTCRTCGVGHISNVALQLHKRVRLALWPNRGGVTQIGCTLPENWPKVTSQLVAHVEHKILRGSRRQKSSQE